MRNSFRTGLFIVLLLGAVLFLSGQRDCLDKEFFDIAVGEPILHVSIQPMVWGTERELNIPITNRGNIPFEGYLYGGLFIESDEDPEFSCGGIETRNISVESVHLDPSETQAFSTWFHVCRPGDYIFTVKLFSFPEDLVAVNNTNTSTTFIEYIEVLDVTHLPFWYGIDGNIVSWQFSLFNNGTLPLMFDDGENHTLLYARLISPDGAEIAAWTSYLFFFLLPFEEEWEFGRFPLEEWGWYSFLFEIDPDQLWSEADEKNNEISVFFEY